jgi:uncharacterized protein (DUF2141 family)
MSERRMSSDTKFKAVAAPLLIALSKSAFAGTLITEINGIEEAGMMHLAIYDTASAFENDGGDKGGPSEDIIDGIIEWVDTESVTYRFEIPAGNYAIGIFIDTNANEALDRNFLQMPTEQYGFSNNAKGRFGPPSFADAAFNLESQLEIEINL